MADSGGLDTPSCRPTAPEAAKAQAGISESFAAFGAAFGDGTRFWAFPERQLLSFKTAISKKNALYKRFLLQAG